MLNVPSRSVITPSDTGWPLTITAAPARGLPRSSVTVPFTSYFPSVSWAARPAGKSMDSQNKVPDNIRDNCLHPFIYSNQMIYGMQNYCPIVCRTNNKFDILKTFRH